MNDSTRHALNGINQRFYDTHAEAFGQTRDHAWPGWDRAWATVPRTKPLRLLDVGCGNGRFGAYLGEVAARPVEYTGVDSSRALLDRARQRTAVLGSPRLECLDWESAGPGASLPNGPFEAVVAFGVLHHVPGHDGRRALLQAMAARLAPDGVLVATFWRFGAPELEARYAARQVSWSDPAAPPIDTAQLESGDQLLQWGDTPGALRYCHYCDDNEIRALVQGLGLETIDAFTEDGRNGELNRYAILRRPVS